MLTKEEIIIATDLVKGFIREMNIWEQLCSEIENDKSLTFEQQAAKQKEELIKIFVKYCTNKIRKNGKPNTISYGLPESYQYDITKESIIEVLQEESGKIVVSTERNQPMKENFQYVLARQNKELLIDSKKRESSWEKKWKVVSL